MTISTTLTLIAVSICIAIAATYVLLKLLFAKTSSGFLSVAHSERSNHDGASRQLGGLVIVPVSIGMSAIAVFLVGEISTGFVCFLLSLVILFLVSFIDDLRSLSIDTRLFFHFMAVGLAIYGLADRLAEMPTILQFLIITVAVLAVVYWINLVNFMDGIDLMLVVGLGIPLGFLSVTLLAIDSISNPLALTGIMFVGGLIGFLKFNWPPAKIIMGDSGSIVFGLVSAMLMLGSIEHVPLVAIILPFLYFAGDVSLTLVMRLMQGKNILRSHSEHGYQIAFRREGSRLGIITTILKLNFVLIALALMALVFTQPLFQGLFLIAGVINVAYVLRGFRKPSLQ